MTPNPYTSQPFCAWVKLAYGKSVKPGTKECRRLWDLHGQEYLFVVAEGAIRQFGWQATGVERGA